MSSMFSLEGKVILVTGASRGLSWSMARALAQAGGRIALNGRDAALLEQRQQAIRAEGGEAETFITPQCLMVELSTVDVP